MSARMTYFLGFLIICFILGTSIYLQVIDGIMPCPLCTMQRFSFALLGIIFLLGLLLGYKRWGRIVINLLLILASTSGLFFAGRQMWLQHFPTPDAEECGVSLQYMLQVLPLNQVAQKIFAGSAECSQTGGFQFLSLNMAEWALIWFTFFFIVSAYLMIKELRQTTQRQFYRRY